MTDDIPDLYYYTNPGYNIMVIRQMEKSIMALDSIAPEDLSSAVHEDCSVYMLMVQALNILAEKTAKVDRIMREERIELGLLRDGRIIP